MGKINKSKLKKHFWDIPEKEGKYLIYRIVGVLNFLNFYMHKKRIISLAKKEDSIVVLSLRYMNIIDENSLEALKGLIDEIEFNNPQRRIPKNSQSEFMKDGEIFIPEITLESVKQSKKKIIIIIITGLSQNKYNKINDNDWFRKMRNKGKLILGHEINLDFKF